MPIFDCRNCNCDGEIDVNKKILLRVGCSVSEIAFSCSKCGALYFAEGHGINRKFFFAENRAEQRAFLVDGRVEHRDKDWIIEEYEEKIEQRNELKDAVDNPSPGRLHSRHLELERHLRELNNEVYWYERAKGVIDKGLQLIVLHLEESGDKIAYFEVNGVGLVTPILIIWKMDSFVRVCFLVGLILTKFHPKNL
ncbi:MAG: hypothetical protein K9M15_02260 [Candidatus Marinimicrobia bacterium]|nr:hypothetical protein [Candidatus Neomarinimicrobiota bacterium]